MHAARVIVKASVAMPISANGLRRDSPLYTPLLSTSGQGDLP
jgi:hypothetical protein